MKKLFFVFAILIACNTVRAQRVTPQDYVKAYKDMAIREMKRMGIPASITLAQGILETESGNSELLKKSNNHFGIKCKSSWTAAGVTHDDDAPGECFRSYKDAEGSYRDHSNYLRGNDRYAPLFTLDPRDYKGWAYGLKKAGYATNPKYPQILIKYIEDYGLQKFTLEAVDEVPFFDASKYKDEPSDKAIKSLPGDMPYEAIANDPHEQVLTINGRDAILAAKGRSLLAIASEYNIPLHKLLVYNDMEEDGLLKKEQYIYLEKKKKDDRRDYGIVSKDEPALPLGMSSTPSKNKKTHEVLPKEGLYSISKKYGVTVSDLKEWNNLQDDNLQIGQQLIVSK